MNLLKISNRIKSSETIMTQFVRYTCPKPEEKLLIAYFDIMQSYFIIQKKNIPLNFI